jgi:hypothetical protein
MILNWLNTAPLPLIAVILLIAMCGAAFPGWRICMHQPASDSDKSDDGGAGYGVSAILGLLALLTGFTFSLAIERFETRRELVLEHANAIGTAYLRVQLLPEPHRARLSGLLTEYTDNVIALAGAPPGEGPPLVAKDDDLLTRLWAATAAGYDSVRELPFSNELVSAMNTVIDTDGARRAARSAHVPTVVFAVLFIYLIGTAGVLGYMLKSRQGRFAGIVLLVLLTLSQLLILDIDRPTMGTIRETQGPMENLRASLKSQPPAVFDRWRGAAGQVAPR